MKMSDFVKLVHDIFSDFGEITSKKMFGGYGLFFQGLMFGLIADETLYLKCDKENEKSFIVRGLPPFTYSRGGKKIKMSYYQAPEEIFEDQEVATSWATLAFAAALRSKHK